MGKQGSIHDEDGAVEHQDIFTSLYNQSIGHMKADVRKSAKSKKKKTSEDRSTSSQKSTIKSSLHHLKSKKKENITRRMRSQSVGRGGRAIQKPPSPIIPPKPQDSLPITSHGDKGKESKLIHSYSYLHSTRSSARKRQSQILKFDKQDREQMLEEIEEDKEVMLKAKNYPKQQDSSLSSQSRISEFEYDSTSDEEGSHGREVDEEDNDMISDFDVDNASLEFNSEEEEGVFDDHSQPVEGLHVPKINKKSREIEQRVPFGVNKRLFMKSIRKSSTKSSSSRNTHSFKPTLNKTTLKLTQNRSSIDVVNRLGTHEVMERKHRQQRRLSQREDMFKVTEDGKPLFQPQINETQLELQSPMDSDDEEEEDEQMGRQVEEEEGKGESDPSNCMDSQSVISDAKSYNRRKGGGVRRRRESCVSQLFKDAQEIEHRREERRRSLVMESQIVLNSQKMNKSNSNKMMSKAIRREVGDLFHVLLWSIEYQKMKDGEQESKKPNEVENDEKDEKEGGEEGKNEEKNSNLEYLLFSQENQEGNKNGDGHEKWRDCQLQFELIDIESINPDLHPIIHQMALIIMTRAESNNEELNPSHFLLDFDSFLSLFQRACKSLHYPLNSLLMTQTRRTKEIVRAEENKALENQLTFQPTLFTKKSYIKPAENKRGRRKKKKKGEENENDDSNSQKKSCSQVFLTFIDDS